MKRGLNLKNLIQKENKVNKRKVISLLNDFGDAIVEFNNGDEAVLVTTDFSVNYIRKSKRIKRVSLKGKMLVFDWTNNTFATFLTKDVKNIIPLSKVLGNRRHG